MHIHIERERERERVISCDDDGQSHYIYIYIDIRHTYTVRINNSLSPWDLSRLFLCWPCTWRAGPLQSAAPRGRHAWPEEKSWRKAWGHGTALGKPLEMTQFERKIANVPMHHPKYDTVNSGKKTPLQIPFHKFVTLGIYHHLLFESPFFGTVFHYPRDLTVASPGTAMEDGPRWELKPRREGRRSRPGISTARRSRARGPRGAEEMGEICNRKGKYQSCIYR